MDFSYLEMLCILGIKVARWHMVTVVPEGVLYASIVRVVRHNLILGDLRTRFVLK